MDHDELDKISDDLFNDLMGKSSNKDESEDAPRPDYKDPDNPWDGNVSYGPESEDLWGDDTDLEGEIDIDDIKDMLLSDEMDESDLYRFEYYLMPQLAETDWIDDSSRDTVLADKEQILDIALDQDIGWINPREFKVEHTSQDNLNLYIYEFPSIPKSPFALYGVIVMGPGAGRYYTLEFEEPGVYMLCNPRGSKGHFNYGTVPNSSKEEFVKNAISLYKSCSE